jgi:hypothetical protein
VTFFTTLQTAHKVYLLGPGWKTRKKNPQNVDIRRDMGWEGRNKMKSSNDSKKAQLRHLLEPTLFLAGFLKEHGSQPGLLFSEGIYRPQAFFFFSPTSVPHHRK